VDSWVVADFYFSHMVLYLFACFSHFLFVNDKRDMFIIKTQILKCE
jgi:hypothetical protein